MKRASARSFLSRSPEETAAFGEALARGLGAGSVILLRGSLGAGKTTLARGLARGFGLEDPMLVSSPSFTLVNEYRARVTQGSGGVLTGPQPLDPRSDIRHTPDRVGSDSHQGPSAVEFEEIPGSVNAGWDSLPALFSLVGAGSGAGW